MNRKLILLSVSAFFSVVSSFASAADIAEDDLASVKLNLQHTQVAPEAESAIEIRFQTAKGWHFYAPDETMPDMSLKIMPQAQGLVFGNPIFPKSEPYFDKVINKNIGIYSGEFSVFVPFVAENNFPAADVNVIIEGVACNNQLCRKADYVLSATLEISADANMSGGFEIPQQTEEAEITQTAGTSISIALPLAVLAGLLLNVMPCVWPILPIIVMRLVSQAEKGKAKSLALGVAFAIGIILFFAALAILNIVLKLGFGLVFQWGDQFRNPAFVIGMALLMIVLALYMFGLFSFGIPASVSSGKQKGGFAGSIGMGFLAAVLSTPCSFAILTFVLAWAQTQPIILATITILLIGVGMAAPYVVLTMAPSLLSQIPKPGRWMELFKHATGFVLLAIAVKLLQAAPLDKLIGILYYAVVLAVCVWMWGVCVSYDTPPQKKWTIRFIAVLLAVLFAFVLLRGPQKGLIDWQPYNEELISSAKEKNQPVLIDFTAEWCISCKVLDKTVYSQKEVADLIKQKGVLAIKADTTAHDYPATIALKEIYNQPAVPVTILLLPDNDKPIALAGIMIKNELITNLRNLKDVEKENSKK